MALTDTIDRIAGIAPGSVLATLRRERPDILALSQRSEEAAIRPKQEGTFSYALRSALACRVARHLKDAELAAHYLSDNDAIDVVARRAADPSAGSDDPRMAAILRHVDLVTLTPEEATRGDIEALRKAGLSDPEIVTLSGIIAFVNYQARVIAGLRIFGAAG